MTLYVYSEETKEVIAKINGESNQDCEKAAEENGYTDETIGWTYRPAFGFNDGLIDTVDAVEIEA